ncbi:2-hydroxyethylphosphonate methyltransferase [subsurface metagenome]
MKILLVNPPIREWSRPNCFPLGLGYIASILLQARHEVEILDINAHRWSREEVERRMAASAYNLIGIGGLVTIYGYIKWLIRISRKYHPDKKIMIGGSAGTSIPRTMLECNPVDIVCMGEGEKTIQELIPILEDKDDLSGVPGIWFKMDDSIHVNLLRKPIQNLDEIPFPAWNLFPMDIYANNPIGTPNKNKWINGIAPENTPLSMNLSASRGCPYQCIFCYHDFMGQRYRVRPVENIIKEIKLLHNQFNITYFHFIDDEFCLKKMFIYEFCNKFGDLRKELKVDITFGCSGRANLMTEKLIATMAEAGCTSIGYGLESGSQKMLDMMKKNVTIEQAEQTVRWTQKYLGWADCSFIVGLPGETKETVQETVNFCKRLNLKPEVIFFATPYPGTELYRIAVRDGKIPDEEQYVMNLGEQGENININFTDFTDLELKKIKEDMVLELGAWNQVRHPQ